MHAIKHHHNNDELDAILKHHTKASCYHNNELDAILKHHVTIIMMN